MIDPIAFWRGLLIATPISLALWGGLVLLAVKL